MQPAVYVTAASIGGLFSGHHLSFVPLVGNENVDFHGESSVNRDLLGISATLARQRKCLVLDSILILGPPAMSWSTMGLCGFLCFYTLVRPSSFGTFAESWYLNAQDRLLLALVNHTSQRT